MQTASFFCGEGVRRAVAAGALADLRDGNQRADDPRGGQMWGPGRTIRADVRAHLLTEVVAAERPRSLRLAGARIVGTLDLEAARLPCPLLLLGCWFEEPVNLAEASVPALRLPGCHLPGLRAAQLTVDGNLELNDGFTVGGEVNLLGAAHPRAPCLLQGDFGQPRETCAQRRADHGGPEHDLRREVRGLR